MVSGKLISTVPSLMHGGRNPYSESQFSYYRSGPRYEDGESKRWCEIQADFRLERFDKFYVFVERFEQKCYY